MPRRAGADGAFWLALARGRRAAAQPPAAAPTEVTDTDRAMMRHALALAAFAAAADETPVGAVVYETATGRLLAQGFNRREADADPAAHAELIAIRAAAAEVGDWRLNHCTLVVTLEPCCMCAGAIVNARLGRVIFAATDPKAGASGSLYNLLADPRLNHRPLVAAGLEADASAALLRAFFRKLRTR
jgi:tRNA(adenine34) deaminase